MKKAREPVFYQENLRAAARIVRCPVSDLIEALFNIYPFGYRIRGGWGKARFK